MIYLVSKDVDEIVKRHFCVNLFHTEWGSFRDFLGTVFRLFRDMFTISFGLFSDYSLFWIENRTENNFSEIGDYVGKKQSSVIDETQQLQNCLYLNIIFYFGKYILVDF